MSITLSGPPWTAVIAAKTLKRKPLSIHFQQQPVVLFRSDDRVAALLDRCPHRGAQLSTGKICGTSLQCPYHGWQFDISGHQTGFPGVPATGKCPAFSVKAFEAMEEGGLIWLREQVPGADSAKRFLPEVHHSHTCFTVTTSINAKLVDVAENFLDALHTHLIHPGIVRSRNRQRHACDVSVTQVEDGYQALYVETKQQSGLVSRLFGQHIRHSIGRIRHPGIVEIEYHSDNGIELSVVIYLRQETEQCCQLIVRNYFRRRMIPGWLQQAVLAPFLYLTLKQDKHILESSALHLSRYPDFQPIISRYDVMRPYIEKALKGQIDDTYERLQLML
ncbi:Rieske 2Fe-2S domain-containing protein [Gynuella sunshinyii]|uniref:Phenylpropionate dioxygenase and related ring-hydroxylating dioxygenase, large terminal subunit n=1 Tax=Gynuella sunshinyii YC6258 TaxID=1445510 RepID=A0A0C5W5D8_9GAMM|nr:Rieske 2Fe-2S domain-containing protein [Gynuella sunshinyii]AJQ97804.1 phenylpropionate dioxygenase and related ring-hydroxylating dioxygenase, large terminal subunit [Gynuella sunshinyii YC6258]